MISSGIKRVLKSLKTPLRVFLTRVNSTISTDKFWSNPSDGFGSKPATNSRLPAPSTTASPLQDVQVLTRFCCSEQPYWAAFVDHYRSMGIHGLHVGVQMDEDQAFLAAFARQEPVLPIVVHRLTAELDPSAALKVFDLGAIAGDASFTLMVDCDEYFCTLDPSRSIKQLFNIFPTVPSSTFRG